MTASMTRPELMRGLVNIYSRRELSVLSFADRLLILEAMGMDNPVIAVMVDNSLDWLEGLEPDTIIDWHPVFSQRDGRLVD